MANEPELNLHTYKIVPEYSYRAIYKVHKLPTLGELYLNGTKMKVGDLFTQEDIENDRISYKQTFANPTITNKCGRFWHSDLYLYAWDNEEALMSYMSNTLFPDEEHGYIWDLSGDTPIAYEWVDDAWVRNEEIDFFEEYESPRYVINPLTARRYYLDRGMVAGIDAAACAGPDQFACDEFKFTVPISDTAILKPNNPPRSACMPPHGIPEDGIYTYPISILVIPAPNIITNKRIELWAGQTHCLSRKDLFVCNPGSFPEEEVFRVNSVSHGTKETWGEWTIDGKRMEIGDTFTQKDIDRGKVCYRAECHVQGAALFTWTVTNQVGKRAGGATGVDIKDWPEPRRVQGKFNEITVVECGEITVDNANLEFWTSGVKPEAIVYTVDTAKTGSIRSYFSPSSFSQQDVNDGRVKIVHACGEGPLTKFERIYFDVCIDYGYCQKCVSSSFGVTIKPLPIVVPKAPANIVTSPITGCSYNFNPFTGGWEPVGTCGIFLDIGSRVVPPPEEQVEGTIVRFAYPEDGTKDKTIIYLDRDEEGNYTPGKRAPYETTPMPEGGPPKLGEKPEVHYVAPKRQGGCNWGDMFTDDKSVVWICGEDRNWYPVTPTVPGGNPKNADPSAIIRAEDHGTKVEPGVWPSNTNLDKVDVKGKGRYIRTGVDEWIPDLKMFKESYGVMDFTWVGPNEYWVKNGTFFVMNFSAAQFYIRFDIMQAPGAQIVPGHDIERRHRIGKGLDHRPDHYYYTSIESLFNWKQAHVCRHDYFLSDKQHLIRQGAVYKSKEVDLYSPYSQGEYFIDYNDQMAIFITSMAPVKVPFMAEVQLNNNTPRKELIWMPGNKGLRSSNTQVSYWEGILRNKQMYLLPSTWKDVPSFANFDGALGYNNRKGPRTYEYTPPATHYVAASGRADGLYGVVNADLHYNGWSKVKMDPYYETGSRVPKYEPYRAWSQATLFLLDRNQIKDNWKTSGGGPYDVINGPRNRTFTFQVRGYNHLTGQTKYRTYTVHYNETGRSPEGWTSKINDIQNMEPMLELPETEIAYCEFYNDGRLGNCYWTNPPE